jgi:hypothetical protein
MALVKVAFVFLVGVFVLAPEARAIDPGVVYEPGSPAGKEYALPLEEARREAGSPGSGGSRPSYEAFGVGVGPAGQGGGESDRGGDGARGETREADGDGGGADGDGGDERGDIAVSRAGLAEAESAGGSFGWSAMIILAVLLPGALLAFGLGRLQRGRGAGHGPRNTSASRGAHRSTE